MALTGSAFAADFREVSFTASDGATVYANLYGKGHQTVVLAHGRAFNKESWDAQAQELVDSGLLVLAIDSRNRNSWSGLRDQPTHNTCSRRTKDRRSWNCSATG